ncbi:MAG: methylmalonyl-CoA mutase family protein [Saprospiraceae bacterium]
MSDWNYTFDPISKANWLKQIEADLQPRVIDSILTEWWPGEIMMPTQHADDRQQSIRLPDRLFVQAPRIMEWIDTSVDDAKTINKRILDTLNYGVEYLVLYVDADKKMPFRLWLDGVLSDVIEIAVSLHQESPEIIHAVREIIPRSALMRLNRKNKGQSSSVFLEALQGSIDENAKSYRFIYEIPSTGEWTKQTADIFQLIINDLTYWTSQGFNRLDFLENCILKLTPDTQYLKQIIQTRVLHLVWNNLWNLTTNPKNISTSSYLECHILPDNMTDPDKYLIRSSTSVLAASLTGSHAICIHHFVDRNRPIPDYYKRIDRNIHHLLDMESEVYKAKDPLTGSYSLDYYTHRWTTDIWSRIQF